MTPTPGEGVIIAVVLYDESSCLLWLWDGIGTMFDNVPERSALHLLVFLLYWGGFSPMMYTFCKTT
jgi:hypothetical protein